MPSRDAPKTSVIQSNLHNDQYPVCLSVVAVVVVTFAGLLKALAFVDGGSDTTVMSEKFAQENSLSRSQTFPAARTALATD